MNYGGKKKKSNAGKNEHNLYFFYEFGTLLTLKPVVHLTK